MQMRFRFLFFIFIVVYRTITATTSTITKIGKSIQKEVYIRTKKLLFKAEKVGKKYSSLFIY